MSQRDAPGGPFRGEGDDAIWSPREEGALRSPPTLKGPLGLNYCDISASVAGDGRRAVVASSLDNLLKGQSGSAMQNLNLMFGGGIRPKSASSTSCHSQSSDQYRSY